MRGYFYFIFLRLCHRLEVAVLRLKIILAYLRWKSPCSWTFLDLTWVSSCRADAHPEGKTKHTCSLIVSKHLSVWHQVKRGAPACCSNIYSTYFKLHLPAVHTVQQTMRRRQDRGLGDPENKNKRILFKQIKIA